jgi:hypothetical protein
MRPATIAVLIACILGAVIIGWTWLRPLDPGALPAPPQRAPRRHQARASNDHAPVAPDDEPAADEPATVAHGVPEMLDRHDLEGALEKVRPRIERCRGRDQFTGWLHVTMVIAKNGSVQSATVPPPLDQSETARCVCKTLRAMSFPRFVGTYLPTIEWTYPFLFRDSAN